MELKWSNGEPPERTKRVRYKAEEVSANAHALSLHHDENTWEILNQSLAKNGFHSSSKREELGDRISSREMVPQIGSNPFLGENNYLHDDLFLKPINSNQTS